MASSVKSTALEPTRSELDGLSYFEREKVDKLIQVKPSSYLNDLLLENDRATIQRTFQNDGDRYCRVETRVEKDEKGNATVIFACRLGLDIKVDQVFYVGLPEARISLSQAATYLSLAPKSNAAYKAVDAALEDVRRKGNRPPPRHPRSAQSHRRRPGARPSTAACRRRRPKPSPSSPRRSSR